MHRRRLAAATVVTFSLLAPLGGPSSASAAPAECGSKKEIRDHKQNKRKAKRKGHHKPRFAHHGKVTAVDLDARSVTLVVRGGQKKFLRGCALTVDVTRDTKLRRNGKQADLTAFGKGDRVSVKGTSTRRSGEINYTAKRVRGKGTENEKQPVVKTCR